MKNVALLAWLFMPSILFADLPCSIEGKERALLTESFATKTVEEIFESIYRTNYWHGWESISGQGSNLSKTQSIRKQLPQLCKDLHITTMIDAPCGDFNWMKSVIDDLGLELYIGFDIVKELIYENQQKYGISQRLFRHANLINDPLPKVDLIFSRDCLAHLSYKNAGAVLRNFKASGSTYLLTSHHVNTQENRDIVDGNHYPINLMCAPFNFPEPMLIIAETDAEMATAHQGKSLALWSLDAIDI